jgi:hypothetical protein
MLVVCSLRCGNPGLHLTSPCFVSSKLAPGVRSIVPDGVTGSETDPLWDRSVLLLGSRELDLCAEGLVAL